MIVNADCLEWMKTQPDNSIDCIITDPPYGLHFMGKDWDKTIPPIEFWVEMLRIIKPGGHLLCAGIPRLLHRVTCLIEDSGWVIRDLVMHIFGSGFPKSHNNFGFEGYGTALKPAWEGWTLAMKPLDGTFAQNAEKWGVAGLNIDATRISTNECLGRDNPKPSTFVHKIHNTYVDNTKGLGRWPANLILSEESAQMLDHQTGVLKSGGGDKGNKTQDGGYGKGFGYIKQITTPSSGGASRFFKVIEDEEPNRFLYCAKASSSERNAGLDKPCSHPTVKPLKLMEYLIKLIMPPKDGILLDPFAGSGTTIMAAKKLGYNAIGIEKDPEYAEIARRRVESIEEPKPEYIQMEMV